MDLLEWAKDAAPDSLEPRNVEPEEGYRVLRVSTYDNGDYLVNNCEDYDDDVITPNRVVNAISRNIEDAPVTEIEIGRNPDTVWSKAGIEPPKDSSDVAVQEDSLLRCAAFSIAVSDACFGKHLGLYGDEGGPEFLRYGFERAITPGNVSNAVYSQLEDLTVVYGVRFTKEDVGEHLADLSREIIENWESISQNIERDVPDDWQDDVKDIYRNAECNTLLQKAEAP